MSFQNIDDCLNFTGYTKVLGKPRFADLKNGHYTLPFLLLRDSDPVFKSMLREYSKDGNDSQKLIDYLLNKTAIDHAMDVSTIHIEKATTAVETIDVPIKSDYI